MEAMADGETLRSLAGFIFDLDGVIYRGQTMIPGAARFLARLRGHRVETLFLTNNATTPPAGVAARLSAMGIPARPADVLTSAQATAAALAGEHPGQRVFVIGEVGLFDALKEAGLRVTEDWRSADTVVVGLDREVTYARLRDAALAIRGGADFVATNKDRTLPTEEGQIPGAGALVGLVELATDRAARSIGKPSPEIFRMASRRLAAPAERIAAVGDRPDTDIAGGHAAGLRTIGVLTGVGTRESFAALPSPPDWVFEDLAALESAYFSA
jgi:4-nitrophenyl phosphatase